MKREKVRRSFGMRTTLQRRYVMSRKMLCGATLAECLVLALVGGMLTLPGSALADPPDGNGSHNHGGGGGGSGFPVTGTFWDDVVTKAGPT